MVRFHISCIKRHTVTCSPNFYAIFRRLRWDVLSKRASTTKWNKLCLSTVTFSPGLYITLKLYDHFSNTVLIGASLSLTRCSDRLDLSSNRMDIMDIVDRKMFRPVTSFHNSPINYPYEAIYSSK